MVDSTGWLLHGEACRSCWHHRSARLCLGSSYILSADAVGLQRLKEKNIQDGASLAHHRYSLFHSRPSFRVPEMTARNHQSGAVLCGKVIDCYTIRNCQRPSSKAFSERPTYHYSDSHWWPWTRKVSISII